jgi:hypothetical protein
MYVTPHSQKWLKNMDMEIVAVVKMQEAGKKIFLQNVLTRHNSGPHNVGSFQQQLSTRGHRMARLDVTKIIKDLGGATKIVELLKAKGINGLTVKAVEKWRERGTIPMSRWLQIRRLTKTPLDLEDYLLPENKK